MSVNNSKIKVLHVIHSLHVGGAENVVSLYAIHHTQEKYSLEICVYKPGGQIFEELKKMNIKIHCLDESSSSLQGFLKLFKILKGGRFDVVHFHNPLPGLVGIPAAVWAKNKLKVLTEHSIDYEGRLGLGKYYYNFIRRFLNVIIACSCQVKLTHKSHTGNHDIKVIYNGIDLNVYHPRLKNNMYGIKIKLPENSTVLGHIGNLTPQKGQLILLKAMRNIIQAGFNAILLVIGDGPLKNMLVSKVGEYDISDRVIFLGQRRDIPEILNLVDIVVGASLREGFPMSVLEAMAAGKPVVTTDVGGNREAIKNNISGILVPVGDAKSLSLAVIDLIANKSKRERIGKEARRRVVEKFSIEKMIEDTENIYYQLIMNYINN